MNMHLSTTALVRLVRGELAGSSEEVHVDGCDDCALAVMREAGLELALERHFREQRCGTIALGILEPRIEPADIVPTGRSPWPVFALTAALLVLAAWIPGVTTGVDEPPCAGIAIDGGPSADVPEQLTFVRSPSSEAHGTP